MTTQLNRNQGNQIATNARPNSQCPAGIKPVTFQELWNAYPSEPPYKVKGKVPKGYENQCAIRMSTTFHATGSRMASFSQNTVKPQAGRSTLGRILLNGKATATRADELARWLESRPICGIGRPENITEKNWQEKIKGRRGVIFFGEYWSHDSDAAGQSTGGHIDLWNQDTLTRVGWTSFFRFTLGIDSLPSIALGGYSDLGKSKKILFFEVKQ